MSDIYPYNFSEIEMYLLENRPWIDELSPVYVKDAPEEVYMQSPLLRQVRRLLHILDEQDGIKHTSIGNLPSAVVKELYYLGVPDWYIEKYSKGPSREDKVFTAGLTKILCLHCKFIRRYKGRFVLTKAGREIMDKPKALLERLLFEMCTSFNMGYFDLMYEQCVTWGAAAMYVELAKRGKEYLPMSHYKDAYLDFYPQYEVFDCPEAKPRWNGFTHCLSCRIFERSMLQLGLVEIDKARGLTEEEDKVRTTPLFDQLIGVRLPVKMYVNLNTKGPLS